MLLLIFQSGKDRYGLAASRIIEVAPRAALKQVPHAPEGMAGLLNYRGTIVPVIDLSTLLAGTASPARLSTRIILVDVSREAFRTQLLGFMAERVTETVQYNDQELRESGVAVPDAPYLGKIMLDQHAMIQLIDPTAVLSESLKASLFALAKESAHG